MQNYESRLQGSGLSLEQYLQMMGMTVDSFRAQNRVGALQSIKSDLVLEAVVKAESIDASEEEIEAEVTRLSTEYGMEAEKIKGAISAEQLAQGVKLDKAAKLIYDSAVVAEAEAAAVEESAE
jgi:trigger factor